MIELRHRCPRCGSDLALAQHGQTICPKCAAVYNSRDGIPSFVPSPRGDGLQAIFDELAGSQRETKLSYGTGESVYLDRQLMILSDAFLGALARWVPQGSLILDVGCGHGALLHKFAASYRLVGIDFAFSMLAPAEKLGYTVYHGDAAALPFADDQFDAVICSELLQLYPSPHHILAELARVCKPRGSVIVSTLNKTSFLRFLVRHIWWPLRRLALPTPILLRTPAEVADAANGLALATEDVGWVLSPTRAVHFSSNLGSRVAPLATNFIVRFRKLGTIK